MFPHCRKKGRDRQMDKLAKYRELIKRYFSQYVEGADEPEPGPEDHLIFDDEHGRYMLFRTGWFQGRRVRAVSLYVRLHNNKIWIEEDWTVLIFLLQ